MRTTTVLMLLTVLAYTACNAVTAVTGVTLNKNSTAVLVGGTEQLTATVTPATAVNKNVTWSSSDTGIATVSTSGLINGVAAGNATITVTTEEGGFSASCAVTVSTSDAAVSVTGVTLNKTSVTLLVGGTEPLAATTAPSNATNQNVTWSSSDTGIATVSTSGLVTGVQPVMLQ
jgi:uncharacterized protein YjdB